MNNQNAFLKVENLTKKFISKSISVSFSLEKGKALSLLGPSGCGKTTVLKMIAGLILPDSGTVTLNGKDITYLDPAKRKIGMVFQDYALFPHLNVEENIIYGLISNGYGKKHALKEIDGLLDLFNLRGLEKQKIHTLSGGEKQRVSLARSLAVKPFLLLFDEPLSALDEDLRLKLRKELKKNREELGYTAIYVTHDKNEALELSDEIINPF